MSSVPPAIAVAAAPRDIRTRCRVASAPAPNREIETTRAMTRGQRPAEAGVRCKATRKSPTTSPDGMAICSPRTMVPAGTASGPSGVAPCPTSTIATTARRIPIEVSEPRESPPPMPTATGTSTAQTAVTGATIVIGAVASA